MDWRKHIAVDPQVMHGSACIAGTRIPVSVVLVTLASGMTSDELVAEYPTTTPASLGASRAYPTDMTP